MNKVSHSISSSQVTRIDHVAINVTSLAEGIEFYTNIVGLGLIETPPDAVANKICWLNIPGGGMLHLIESNVHCSESLAHFALRVPNLVIWQEHMKSQGIPVVEVPIQLPGVQRMYLRDPFGNLFECIEYLPAERSPLETMHAFLTALTRYDFTAAKRLATPDCKIIEQGKIYACDEIIKLFEELQRQLQRRVISIEPVSVQATCDQASLVYKHTATIESPHQKTFTKCFIETACLERSADSWRVALLHSTLLESAH